jgi:hypothetical protein
MHAFSINAVHSLIMDGREYIEIICFQEAKLGRSLVIGVSSTVLSIQIICHWLQTNDRIGSEINYTEVQSFCSRFRRKCRQSKARPAN